MVGLFTSVDVARLAGVSQSTVSYVMSGKRPISEKTRRRVEAAMAQLTYQPNAGARALASQRTRVVGLVAPVSHGADHAGLVPFVETIAASVREHDHDLLLVTTDEGPGALERLARRRLVDALVLMEVEARDPRIPLAASLDLPVMLIGVPDEPAGLSCVDLDFAAGARLAVAEAALTGRDEVVVVAHSREVVARDVNYVRRFTDAAEAAAAAHGMAHRLVQPVENSLEGARGVLAEALAGSGRPALVVPNSGLVPLVLRVMREAGVRPGADVPVVAVCTDLEARAGEPPVTNVSLEPRDVSRRAVATLFRLLDGRDATGPAGGRGGAGAVELVAPRLTRRATTEPAG